MKRFVIFDLDGTLLNTLPDIAGAMNRVLFRHGLPQHKEDSYKAFTGNGAKILTLRAIAGHEDLFDKVYPEYLQEYAGHSRVDTQPYDGIPELLTALHQQEVSLIVYSNKDDPDAKEVVAHYFPQVPFLEVVGATADFPLKPSPDALNHLMENHGLQPENGLYLGDTVVDMQCAKAAGITAVAALWGFQPEVALKAENPEHLITHPLDVMPLLDKEMQ